MAGNTRDNIYVIMTSTTMATVTWYIAYGM